MAGYEVVRWGVLGAARIAQRFVEGVQSLPDHRVAAVGARDGARAAEFARRHGIPRSHQGYDALVADPEVDIVYVATTHNFHKEHSLLALNAGKPVLCEKPFTISRAELEVVVRAAREKRLFLMEGMWTRFFPAMARLRDLLREGAIGEPLLVQADFGFKAAFDPSSRLFDPNLGGGALLDVGVYVVSFASMVLGSPDRVAGFASKAPNGVDDLDGIVLGHPSGAVAVLATAVRANTPHQAVVVGSEGRILVPPAFWKPERLVLSRNGRPDEEIHLPSESTGFQHEAREAARCLRQGLLESPVMPLDESLAIMGTLDALRAQWGVRYPME